MASREARERVMQALREGANPRGLSGENAEAYADMVADGSIRWFLQRDARSKPKEEEDGG